MTTAVRLILLGIVLLLAGCATTCPPPRNKENVNAIFHQYPQWYKAAKKTERKWGVPVNVQMAIIYYESAFKGDARPPRKYFLGIFPGKHITSAYGYAQALDGTWEDYLAKEGSWFAKRNKFESATDFIGWYSAQARQRLGIPQNDAYHLYLAYHEGLGGYEHRTYLKKPWLIGYAKKVEAKSELYQMQLAYYEHGDMQENDSPPVYMPAQTVPTEPPIETEPELEPPSYYVLKSTESGSKEDDPPLSG